jgi:transcriptional regulator GlxA family with amidase domain
LLDLAGPLEVFDVATHVAYATGRAPGYQTTVIAPRGGPIASSSRLEVVAQRGLGRVPTHIDTLMLTGGGWHSGLRDAALLRFVRRAAERARRVASICTGAFGLAEAGLLDGKRATTHWAYAEALAERYPAVQVDPDPIFVRDGRVYTSAGITAGMDLALALVEGDLGPEVARRVARHLVMFVQRPGGQSQFSAQLRARSASREPLKEVQSHVIENIGENLSVPALARRAGMSPRNFARAFAREAGVTPGVYVERARVEAARRMLEQTSASLVEVATHSGLGSVETLRRAFGRQLGVNPSSYRQRFRCA